MSEKARLLLVAVLVATAVVVGLAIYAAPDRTSGDAE